MKELLLILLIPALLIYLIATWLYFDLFWLTNHTTFIGRAIILVLYAGAVAIGVSITSPGTTDVDD